MSNAFVLPEQVPLTIAGKVYPGAKASFFRTGTATPKNTYADAALTTPHPNPVIADSGGSFPTIYLDTSDFEYRLTLKTSADVLIYTQDNVGGKLTQAEFNALMSAAGASAIGAVLFPRTAAEISAGVTPTSYLIPSHATLGFVAPERYGAVSDASTNCNTALANALLVCAQAKAQLFCGPGSGYLCTQNLSVPVGSGNTVDIIGSGWATGGIRFSGAAVTTGLTFTGSGWSYCGSVRDLRIVCVSSAARGITATDCNMPSVSRCYITAAAGAGVAFLGCLMSKLEHTLFVGCGSATEGTVEIDRFGAVQSTTFSWYQCYISGGNTTVGGLIIGRTPNCTIVGGAIETCGIHLRIGHRANTVGCVGGIVHSVDFENPGAGPYIDIGAGLSGGAFVSCWDIRSCNGSPSGATDIDYSVVIANGIEIVFDSCNWAQVGTPVATFNLSGANNFGIEIKAHRNLGGLTYPWVIRNGSQQFAAGPYADWSSENGSLGRNQQGTIAGATPSVLVSSSQGGYYRLLATNNAGATTITNLSGGEFGMEINIYAADANTTLTHSTVTAGQFNLVGGVNLPLIVTKIYRFYNNGVNWVQI